VGTEGEADTFTIERHPTGVRLRVTPYANIETEEITLSSFLDVYQRILERHPEDAGARAMVEKLQTELAARHRPKEPA